MLSKLTLVALMFVLTQALDRVGAVENPTRLVKLADLLAAPEASELTAVNIGAYFTSVITIVNYSRDPCTPVLKAATTGDLSVESSMLGVVYNAACGAPKRLFFMKLTVSATADDFTAMATELYKSLGQPCGEQTVSGEMVEGWRNKSSARALSLDTTRTKVTALLLNYDAVSQTPDSSNYRKDVGEFEDLLPEGCRK